MKPSEKRLIMVLAILAAISGGVILTQRLLGRQHGLERREQTLELRRTEAVAMLAEADLWKQRLEWLQASQPSMTSDNEASKELLEGLLSSAATNNVTVQKKQLHEPVNADFYREIGVTLTVKGALPPIFRWMYRLLSPESFCRVTAFKVVPDSAEPSSVVATIRFSRLYLPAVAAVEEPAK
jgi:hypothetical protein